MVRPVLLAALVVFVSPGLRAETDGAPGCNLAAADGDHQFDRGSKIKLSVVTPLQVRNLSTLCKVWGYLKYRHPKITSGKVQWDHELFRVMPSVLNASSEAGANEAMNRWIDGLGEISSAVKSSRKGFDIDLLPDVTWIHDVNLLGSALGGRLCALYLNPQPNVDQFYVSLAAHVRNPVFVHEMPYPEVRFPDSGYQLLALFRFWNIIRYWSPYRDLIDENWDAVLDSFIPRFAKARTYEAYQLQLFALIVKVGDTHANLWSSIRLLPPRGDCQWPIIVRFVEGRPIVAEVIGEAGGLSGRFCRGDIIESIDGLPVGELVDQVTPYYAASNEPTRRRDIARFLGRGPAGPMVVRVQRGTTVLDVKSARVRRSLRRTTDFEHDLPGPAFRLLSWEVAYLKLSSVTGDEALNYLLQAQGTKGWILDARSLPSDIVWNTLGPHLIGNRTTFVRFTVGNLGNPGEFDFTEPGSVEPSAPRYSGRIVILVDEMTQSSSEFQTMMFRAVPGAVVVGSTTAGADGNVSRIPLPGGLQTMISGIGIFYPDKRPTQRIGIIPDVEVHPTVAGIQAGRDEVLEMGLKQILGSEASDEQIKRLASVRE